MCTRHEQCLGNKFIKTQHRFVPLTIRYPKSVHSIYMYGDFPSINNHVPDNCLFLQQCSFDHRCFDRTVYMLPWSLLLVYWQHQRKQILLTIIMGFTVFGYAFQLLITTCYSIPRPQIMLESPSQTTGCYIISQMWCDYNVWEIFRSSVTVVDCSPGCYSEVLGYILQ